MRGRPEDSKQLFGRDNTGKCLSFIKTVNYELSTKRPSQLMAQLPDKAVSCVIISNITSVIAFGFTYKLRSLDCNLCNCLTAHV